MAGAGLSDSIGRNGRREGGVGHSITTLARERYATVGVRLAGNSHQHVDPRRAWNRLDGGDEKKSPDQTIDVGRKTQDQPTRSKSCASSVRSIPTLAPPTHVPKRRRYATARESSGHGPPTGRLRHRVGPEPSVAVGGRKNDADLLDRGSFGARRGGLVLVLCRGPAASYSLECSRCMKFQRRS